MSKIAEKSVIGALLQDINCIKEIYEELKPDMFESRAYGQCYLEIMKLYDTMQPINLVILTHQLKACGYSEASILESLKDCVDSTITTTDIKSYADVIISNYKKLRLTGIMSSVNPSENDVDQQIGMLINELEELKKSESVKLKGMGNIVSEYRENLFVKHESNGIKLGFPRLDDMLVELEKGDVTVIGARPAVGKSAFVTQIIRNLSKSGKKGAFYNLEMSDKQIYQRMLAAESGIDLKRIRMAQYYLGNEKEKIEKANEKIEKI